MATDCISKYKSPLYGKTSGIKVTYRGAATRAVTGIEAEGGLNVGKGEK